MPSGFNGQTTTGTHSGPLLTNPNPTGWTPSGINSYIWWSGRASNYIGNGKLYWSNVQGTGVRANYIPAMLDCYETINNNRSRFDKDLDNFSFCNSFNALLFDCNDTNASQNPSITEVCNGLDDNCRYECCVVEVTIQKWSRFRYFSKTFTYFSIWSLWRIQPILCIFFIYVHISIDKWCLGRELHNCSQLWIS